MRYKSLLLLLVVVVMGSCTSNYRKLQMSNDPDAKFDAAKVFFQEKRYAKAAAMFEEVVSYYRGSAKAEEVLFLLSESYMKQKDFYSASEYYRAYIRNYPRGVYADAARYNIGYCYYLESPDPRLDQENTLKAIEAFSEYIEFYPNSADVDNARKYLYEMYDKIAYKGFLNAKLYYNLGVYGGNNYQAAIITAEEALKEFPETTHREELLFVILRAKYKEALNSVKEKGKERFSEVIDEYYRFANEFADGKHIKEANKILKSAKQIVK